MIPAPFARATAPASGGCCYTPLIHSSVGGPGRVIVHELISACDQPALPLTFVVLARLIFGLRRTFKSCDAGAAQRATVAPPAIDPARRPRSMCITRWCSPEPRLRGVGATHLLSEVRWPRRQTYPLLAISHARTLHVVPCPATLQMRPCPSPAGHRTSCGRGAFPACCRGRDRP